MGKKYKAVTTDNLRAILPVDWLLLEAENDPQGVRLIVIEIYNHYRYNCPHLYYIRFSRTCLTTYQRMTKNI